MCLAARAMVHMLSSTASAPGVGWVEEHRRGVCGSEGDGVNAVEGDVRLRGGRGVGVCGGCGRGHTRELRGGQWQYGEGGGGGMERAVAVGRRGRRQWDVEGGRTARAGGMSVWAGSTSVWAGSMLEWGVRTMGEGA